MTPLDELVNVSEFEAVARQQLNAETYGLIAEVDRKAFDRITLRPRMMVDTRKLNLTVNLFGQEMFAPILIAPVSKQSRFHAEGEIATARGAAGAKTAIVIADEPKLALDSLIKAVNGAAWFQTDAKGNGDSARDAVSAGCRAVCLTTTGSDWAAVDRFRQGLKVPLLLKGVMSVGEAQAAVQHGMEGIIVSNWVESSTTGLASPIEVLPRIADAVAGKIPILIDGGFRRGNDFLDALALGARAVMVGRPAMWGLSGYGANGVQRVIELMQTALARDMAMCGKVNLQALDRSVVKVHERR